MSLPQFANFILYQIVPVESARFGIPGDRENIVKLNADHGGVCKFGPSLEDQDNFKLVRSNLKDLYKNALKTCELSAIPSLVGTGGSAHTMQDTDLRERLARLKGDNFLI